MVKIEEFRGDFAPNFGDFDAFSGMLGVGPHGNGWGTLWVTRIPSMSEHFRGGGFWDACMSALVADMYPVA